MEETFYSPPLRQDERKEVYALGPEEHFVGNCDIPERERNRREREAFPLKVPKRPMTPSQSESACTTKTHFYVH